MAKNEKKQATKKTVETGITVINQQIQVGQLERGHQTIQQWLRNVKTAERVLNPRREWLLNTYLDISVDLHLDSVQGKRIRALKNVPFEWPGLKSEKHVENLKSPWFYNLIEICGRFIFEGYKLAELKRGDDGLISECAEIPPQNVRPDKKIITRQMFGSEQDAFHYTVAPLTDYILEIGKPTDLGLYLKIAPYVLLKRGNLGDYAMFNHMFGMPLRIYEYDPTDPTARDQCVKQAEAQGAAAYIVVPKGTGVQLAEANKAGATNTYGPFHSLLNDEITIGVLANTLTTSTEGKGSNALGKVHLQVESELAMEDRLFFELFANFVLKPVLIRHGIPIAEEDFYEEFGVPLPKDRKVVTPPAAKQQDPNDPDALRDNNDPDNKDNGKDDDEPGGAGKGKSKGRAALSQILRARYAISCCGHPERMPISLNFEDSLTTLIEDIIRKLWARELKPGDVDTDLWKLISDELEAGMLQGFGTIASGQVDAEMIAALRKNVFQFSGFKTYNFIKEASALLVTENGEVRDFADFRTQILKLNEEYNLNFLRAEYNHAVASARMASKWIDIVKKKDALPLLKYRTVDDNRVRESHRKLEGITLPFDHPFWDEYYPPNDWNDRCYVQQLASGEQTILKPDQLPQLKESFKFNPGKSQQVFPKDHPYYNIPEEDKGKIENSSI
jgi:hypothetical protein